MGNTNETEKIDEETQGFVRTGPLSSLFFQVGESFRCGSDFHKHFTQSKIELLKAVRSVITQRIEHLESRVQDSQTKKATKIPVE